MTLFGLRKTHLPRFEGATGWLNSEPLTPHDLRGKVVVVDFGTYTCINWLRTLPHIRAWAEKYRADGFVVRDLACVQQPVLARPVLQRPVKASYATTTSAKGGTSNPSA